MHFEAGCRREEVQATGFIVDDKSVGGNLTVYRCIYVFMYVSVYVCTSVSI